MPLDVDQAARTTSGKWGLVIMPHRAGRRNGICTPGERWLGTEPCSSD